MGKKWKRVLVARRYRTTEAESAEVTTVEAPIIAKTSPATTAKEASRSTKAKATIS